LSTHHNPSARAVKTIHVIQGEHKISRDSDVCLVTILGSCVAACIRDPVAGIGGMNHFLLPGGDGTKASDAERHGVHQMELLVNALLAQGASRRRLEAKLFGGAKTIAGRADVGSMNADFAANFLRREQIAMVGECLRGNLGRRVQYWPISGRARRSFLDYAQDSNLPVAPVVPTSSGSLELF
jgi:chemotaxis protein CheD